MMELKPIVYTRPFTRDDDFRFFARPETLKGNLRFEDRIVNALSTEGYRGGIKDRRWHVLRIQDSIIVGLATQEFHRMDEYGRNLRGYYGFALPLTCIEKPDVRLFCELDKYIVEPLFREANLEGRDFGVLRDGVFADETFYCKLNDQKVGRRFNHDMAKVLYIPTDEPFEALINDTILEAKKYDDFECVIGLNSRKHAEESKVQNCLCYDQQTALIVSLSQKPLLQERIAPQKAGAQCVRTVRQDHVANAPEVTGYVEPSRKEEGGGFVDSIFRLFGISTSVDEQHSRPQKIPERAKRKVHSREQTFPTESGVEKHMRGWKVESATPKNLNVCDDMSNGLNEKDIEHNDTQTIADRDFKEILRSHFQLCRAIAEEDGKEKIVELCQDLSDVLSRCGAIRIDCKGVFDPAKHIDIENEKQVAGVQIESIVIPGWIFLGEVIEKARVKVKKPSVDDDESKKSIDGDALYRMA